MDTIILAGGYANRLWPLTEEYPKSLLGLAGQPVLRHLLDNINEVPDVDNIVISIDQDKRKCFDEMKTKISSSQHKKVKYSIHDVREDDTIKGALEKLFEVHKRRKELKLSNKEFWILGGDNVFGMDLNKFLNHYRALGKKEPCQAIQDLVKPLEGSHYGFARLDDQGRILEIIEKPSHQRICTACYIFQPEDLECLGEYLRNGGEDNLGIFGQFLVSERNREMQGCLFSDPWFDIGTLKGLLAANAMFLDKGGIYEQVPINLIGQCSIHPPLFVERTTTIKSSKLGSNVYVGQRCHIHNSDVKGSIIYDDCTIHNAVIRDSVIGPGSIIEGHLIGAVIGPGNRLIISGS